MIPTLIKLTTTEKGESNRLALAWDDGHEGVIRLKTLRDNCPCAGCKGETVLLKTYTPARQPELPGKYRLTGAQPVGSYALAVSWGDGHKTGIYTWETLRSLCECDICIGKR